MDHFISFQKTTIWHEMTSWFYHMYGTSGREKRKGCTHVPETSSLTSQEEIRTLSKFSTLFLIWRKSLLRFLAGNLRWFLMISLCSKVITLLVLMTVPLCQYFG